MLGLVESLRASPSQLVNVSEAISLGHFRGPSRRANQVKYIPAEGLFLRYLSTLFRLFAFFDGGRLFEASEFSKGRVVPRHDNIPRTGKE